MERWVAAIAKFIDYMSIALSTPDGYSRPIPAEKSDSKPRCRRFEKARSIGTHLCARFRQLRCKVVDLRKAEDEFVSTSFFD